MIWILNTDFELVNLENKKLNFVKDLNLILKSFSESSKMQVPIKFWCREIEGDALKQLLNLSSLPFVFDHVSAMADTHIGYAMPIGGVTAFNDVLIPYCVGSDISCGVSAAQTDYLCENINPELINKIMKNIEKIIPHGKGIGHKEPQRWNGFEDAPEFPSYIKSSLNESKYQLGTLGSGNHFINLMKGDDGYIWLLLHSGSRNLGYQICNEFTHQAKCLMEIYHIKLPDPNLAYLPIETIEGKQYYELMKFAISYAMENRQRMMNIFMSVTCRILGCSIQQEININHNYASFEHHFNKNIIVHRKGATSARKDESGIIPGSMGTPSYIVKGLGNKDSFESCSHGAGRIMSRKEAKRIFKKEEMSKLMEGIWLNTFELDEDPRCYKNIDEIIKLQSDLIEPIVKLYPMGVLIGSGK